MRKLLSFVLLAAGTLFAGAYEYPFDWAGMSANAYSNEQTVTSKPASGIDLYINTRGDVAPYIYAWLENGTELFGGWPGTKMTDFKAVSRIGNENNKTGFYKVHVNSTEFRFIVSFNGSADQSSTTVVKGNGTYFFSYDGTLHGSLSRDVTFYQESTNNNNCNVYVQVKGSDIVPYIYTWSQWYTPQWPRDCYPMSQQNVMGEQWYAQNITTGSSVIFSDKGNDNTKTADITPTNGDNFYYYYPNGDGDRYETVAFMANNHNNYKEWDYAPYYTVEGNKVTFTSTGAHGSATFSVVCNNVQDVNKVKVLNGELQFPRYSHLEVAVNDGYNIRQVWLGKPTQGNATYTFAGVEARSNRPEAPFDILDLQTLWDGTGAGADNHLYTMDNGSNVFTTGEVINWNETYFISNHVKVYSEGISLEDLTYADRNVRRQNHAIDHELVGVAVKNVQGKDYLICRSVDELVDNRQTMGADQIAFTDENGNYYPWSNPNMPQYAWIALEVNADDGHDASYYVGKKFTGARGMYCKYDTHGEATWIPWTNPFMEVKSSGLTVTGEEATTLNTYSVANFVNPKDNKYFLLKPSLCELCDIVDVMRSHGDHYMYVPDEKALMPETEGEDGQIYSKPNIYVKLGLNYGQDYSFTSMLDNTEADKAYHDSDVEILGENNLGLNWRLYDKVYDFPSSLVVSAQHANKGGYEYPLTVPNREHTQTTSDNGGLVLHIIGQGVLQKYSADMFVGSSDYWSRYKYGENRNAYRNDVAFSFSRPTVDGNYGTLEVWRCDDKGEKLVQIGQIVHNNPNDLNEFVISALPAAKEAQNEPALTAATTKVPYFPNNFKKPLTADDNIIYLSDMFYSGTMCSADENRGLQSEYQYRLIPSAESTYDLNSMVGSAPVYKTDENVVTRAHYTQEQVDADVDNQLSSEDKAIITFKPNNTVALTEYRVYKGRHNAQAADSHKTIDKSVIEIDDLGFLNPAVEEELGETMMEFVPEVYTSYNDNTYGCYKQEVTNASIAVEASALQASQLTTTDGYKYFHVELDITSLLMAVDKDTRYLVRLWREDADGTITLLNTASNFDEEHVLELNPEWETNYDELNTTTGKAEEFAYTISDTFKARVGSAPAGMRRAGGDEVYGCNYYATLYVKDDATGKFYVKKQEIPVSWSKSVVTAIDDVNAVGAQVASVRYIGMNGVESDKPFQGVNVVVTTYTDGTRTTAKVVK